MTQTVFASAALLTCLATGALPGSARAQQADRLPLSVLRAEILQKSTRGNSADVAITVRNSSTRTVDGWGILVSMTPPTGEPVYISASTDGYNERQVSPAGTTAVAPDGVQTIVVTANGPNVAVEGIDVAARPTYAIYDDDVAIGDEQLIEAAFARRRRDRALWQTAEASLLHLPRGAPDVRLMIRSALDRVTGLQDGAVGGSTRYAEIIGELEQALGIDDPAAAHSAFERVLARVIARRVAADAHQIRR